MQAFKNYISGVAMRFIWDSLKQMLVVFDPPAFVGSNYEITMVNVLKFRTLVDCQKSLNKQCRLRSDRVQ